MTNYEKVKEWRKANPEKVLEQARRYRARHPETNRRAKAKYGEENIKFIRETGKIGAAYRRFKDPTGQKRRSDAFTARKRAKQEQIAGRPRPDKCEICDELNIRIVFDHCHNKGHFRGWICDRCNRVLGLVKDRIDILNGLAKYLCG
jgi:hypothetical protein